MSQDQYMKKIIRKGIDKYLIPKGLSVDGRTLGTKRARPEQIANALTEYYVREIAYYTSRINEEDKIETGLDCDGNNDLGIDFIYEKPEDDEFWIIQSKYRGRSGVLIQNEIRDFFNIHEKIFDPDQRKEANPIVQRLLEGLTKKSSVNYMLLMNTKATPDNKDEFQRLEKAKLAISGTGSVGWNLVDLPKIESKYNQRVAMISGRGKSMISDQGKSRGKLPIVKIPNIEQYIDLPKSSRNNKKYESIAVIVQGTLLDKWFIDHEEALFTHNIRGFLGTNRINEPIEATLAKEPDLFYLYNNGISAICTKMEIKPSSQGDGVTVKCTDFQIINGAQTVSNIYNFNKKGDIFGRLEEVNVLLRITKVEKGKTKEEKFIRNIVTYNNSQNVVKDADFRSNDSVQQNLAAEFKEQKIQYRATSQSLDVVYMPKRAFCSEKRKVIVGMDSLVKSLYAFNKDTPAKINSLTKFLFDEDDTDGYWSLFGIKRGKEIKQVKKIDSKKFKKIAAIVILNHFLESKLMEERKRKGARIDTVDGMVVRTGRLCLWAFGYVIRELYKDLEDEIYAKIINGDAFKSKIRGNSFIDAWYGHIHKSIHGLLTKKIKESESGETLNFKVWVRNDEKIKDLKKALDCIDIDKLNSKIEKMQLSKKRAHKKRGAK